MTTPLGSKTPDQRQESQNASGERSTPPSHPEPSLAGYWSLPGELQQRIVFEACQAQPADYSSTSRPQTPPTRVPRSQLCKRTTLALSAAGRHFYVQTMPLLLNEVRLTRPSSLRAFQAALASRPALGRLVKKLHIGENERMTNHWFPFEFYAYGHGEEVQHGFSVRVSLDTARKRRKEWNYRGFCTAGGASDPISQAMSTAIDAAARDLDIDLEGHSHSRSGCNIGVDAWYVRAFEVQAALELYCLAIGGSNDEKAELASVGVGEADGIQYPRLVVIDEVEQPSKGGDGALVVTRSQVYKRMARAGCDMDDFGHPLLFARSGLPWSAFTPDEGTHHGGSSTWQVDEEEDFGDVFALSGSTPANVAPGPARVPANLSNALDPVLNSAATVGGCLALARSVLSLTPLVHRLSLTGFLERAVAGVRSPPALLGLHSLTLGPSPVSWNVPLHLDHAALHSVKELRICARDLIYDELDSLAGAEDALPELEKLRWSAVEPLQLDSSTSVSAAVERLLGVNHKATAEGSPGAAFTQAPCKKRKTLEGSSSDRRAILVEAFLHPHDIRKILEAAPSDEVRAAWREGKAVHGIRHRLKLQQHNGWMDEDALLHEHYKSWQAMYDEGMEWWDGG